MKPKQVYIALKPAKARLLNLVGEALNISNSELVDNLITDYAEAHFSQHMLADADYQALATLEESNG